MYQHDTWTKLSTHHLATNAAAHVAVKPSVLDTVKPNNIINNNNNNNNNNSKFVVSNCYTFVCSLKSIEGIVSEQNLLQFSPFPSWPSKPIYKTKLIAEHTYSHSGRAYNLHAKGTCIKSCMGLALIFSVHVFWLHFICVTHFSYVSYWWWLLDNLYT